MAAAVALGDRHVGLTGRNPSVGALVVRGGVVVGAGATEPGGSPHAEAVALAGAGEAARGATLHVTLEPCAYRSAGGTSCLARTLRAGIARVVVAVADPNPRIAGRSIAALREAGVEVVVGPGAALAERGMAGHLTWARSGRPHLTVKQAVSADGMIAGPGGGPVAITGPAANAQVHLMRARANAILVGAGTVRTDDPSLTCRLPGLADRSPIRIVLDRNLTMPPGCRLARTAREVPTWVVCRPDADAGVARALERQGVEIIPHAGPLAELFATLGREEGLRTILVEAGARLARALHDAGLIDTYTLFRSPRSIGPAGVAAMSGADIRGVIAAHYEAEGERRHGIDRRIDHRRSSVRFAWSSPGDP